jgi:hypothetical protein
VTNANAIRPVSSGGSTLKSILAVFAGLLVVIILSVGTDAILHATGIYPPWFQPMVEGLWILALAYRIVYGIIGGYLTAWMAPNRPVAHAVILGLMGELLSIVGVAMNWNKGPEFGPKWFSIALVVIALPCSWLGGVLRARKANAS